MSLYNQEKPSSSKKLVSPAQFYPLIMSGKKWRWAWNQKEVKLGKRNCVTVIVSQSKTHLRHKFTYVSLSHAKQIPSTLWKMCRMRHNFTVTKVKLCRTWKSLYTQIKKLCRIYWNATQMHVIVSHILISCQ